MTHTHSNQIKNPDNFHVSLSKLPQTIILKPNHFHAILILIFSFIWLSGSIFAAQDVFSKENIDAFEAIIIMIFLVVGLGSILYTIYSVNSKARQELTFSKESVVRVISPLFGLKIHQTNFYKDFTGVLIGKHTESAGGGDSHVRVILYHTIHLTHPNPKKTIALYKKTDNESQEIDKLWKHYAKILQLPLLQHDGENITSQDLKQTDHLLTQRNTRKGLNKTKPPVGIKLETIYDKTEGKVTTIYLSASQIPLAISSLFLCLFSLPVFASFFIALPAVFPLFGLVAFALITFSIYHHQSNSRKIEITNSKIVITEPTLELNLPPKIYSIHHSDVKQILQEHLKQKNAPDTTLTTQKNIVIVGKEQRILFGNGLSDKALEWLQNYLRAAVVTA